MMPYQEEFAPVRNAIRRATNYTKNELIVADELSKSGKIDSHIIDGIKTSDACIVDITNNRPNVIWEMGFAQSLAKNMIVLTQSVEKYSFFDTKLDRMTEYDLADLDRTLTQELILKLEDNEFRSSSATPVHMAGTPGHRSETSVIADAHMMDSKYNFFELSKIAKNQIFIAAQNHYTLVHRGKEFTKAALEFLSKGDDQRLDIIMCDPAFEDAVSTWNYVNEHRDDRYKNDLINSIKFFENFVEHARANGHSEKVFLKKIPFVPLSATFVDPELNSGLAVVVPNLFQILSHARPYFVISKSSNTDIFYHYWSVYFQKTI